ncbi:MarR family transcriptional regulator [Mycobacteroides chelonae]|jgi:uncharacterized protein YeaO (DUF488 family)|uniref:DUF488 domain-containing protein n=1 Tax=Mycobacteroides chelonae TaxID=1774 RepID=UPI0008A8D940|nr:DUF488 family protein [Mycobacteroides chelonae]PKQ56471.1 MarR family transcriptional regulator [Mycobacterium sp. MHSD3]MBF9520462.1 DUF488 family protein [Mycobacteroides chelonae]MBV0917528.1 DUF488 family protein [Mycobacteroides chelonae]OHT80332.1 MarR family transcriptional regulator [Mycobacteroides chelonae]OHU55070.1 MarR family transcriptional regulator [Mycobacteroides chelonae]
MVSLRTPADKNAQVTFSTKRIYETPDPSDGYRVLVDRLWPRGVSKAAAQVDLWFKDIAPSPDLRVRWHHAPAEEWATYADEYRAELASNPAVDTAHELEREHGTVTLLYAAKDPEHNHAIVLRDFLST